MINTLSWVQLIFSVQRSFFTFYDSTFFGLTFRFWRFDSFYSNRNSSKTSEYEMMDKIYVGLSDHRFDLQQTRAPGAMKADYSTSQKHVIHASRFKTNWINFSVRSKHRSHQQIRSFDVHAESAGCRLSKNDQCKFWRFWFQCHSKRFCCASSKSWWFLLTDEKKKTSIVRNLIVPLESNASLLFYSLCSEWIFIYNSVNYGVDRATSYKVVGDTHLNKPIIKTLSSKLSGTLDIWWIVTIIVFSYL